MKSLVRHLSGVTGFIALACVPFACYATDYANADSQDKDELERALLLCRWAPSNGAPVDAPQPKACTGAAVSIDEALLQMKQWWTFWYRRDGAAATQGKDRFNQEVGSFRRRQAAHPELIASLLPPGSALAADDWRVLLVHELERRR